MQSLHSARCLQGRPAPQARRQPASRCPLRIAAAAAPVAAASSSAQTSAFSPNVLVRPYTLRKGDTLESIAQKRDITVSDVLGINPDLATWEVAEGKTILLPAQKLSKRDKEILDGIGMGYRVYPVRAGETLADVMSKRKIQRSELEALNPGINLDKLTANQLLKLPTNKFTVREREMLIGSRVLPPEFFQAASNPFVVGVSVLMAVCGFVMAWQRFFADKDYLADE